MHHKIAPLLVYKIGGWIFIDKKVPPNTLRKSLTSSSFTDEEKCLFSTQRREEEGLLNVTKSSSLQALKHCHVG